MESGSALALAVVAVALVLGYRIRRARRPRKLWQEAAAAWNARLQILDGSALGVRAMAMETWIEGLHVTASFQADTTSGSMARTERSTITVTGGPPGAAFSVYVGSFGAGRRTGFQLGLNPDFDRLFVVEGTDERAVRLVWTAERQAHMLAFAGRIASGHVDSDGHAITISRPSCLNARELHAAAAFALDLRRASALAVPQPVPVG